MNLDDYVTITSYTHHPMWSKFAVEVQDNWRWPLSYNVPMEDLCKIIDNAVNNGYTVAWGGDVTEDGFTRKGLGIAYDVKKVRSMAAPMPTTGSSSQRARRTKSSTHSA